MVNGIQTLQERLQRADKIIRDPSKYKICLGCESILTAEVPTCPNCHAYRFEGDQSLVIAQARRLSGRERQTVLASDFE
jgi:uncharacterized paraquat-inducible protein A